MKKFLILLCVLFLLAGSQVYCLGPKIDKHIAVWDANSETDLAGYYLYWKIPTGTFSDANRVVVVKTATPNFDLMTLSLPSGNYVIAVSAYNTYGNESGLSNEVDWNATIPDIPKNANIEGG